MLLSHFTALLLLLVSWPLHRSGRLHGRADAAREVARAHSVVDRGRDPPQAPAAEIRLGARGLALPWRAAARRGCRHPRHGRATGAPRGLGPDQDRRPRLEKLPRAAAPRLPRRARLALDAGVVSGTGLASVGL